MKPLNITFYSILVLMLTLNLGCKPKGGGGGGEMGGGGGGGKKGGGCKQCQKEKEEDERQRRGEIPSFPGQPFVGPGGTFDPSVPFISPFQPGAVSPNIPETPVSPGQPTVANPSIPETPENPELPHVHATVPGTKPQERQIGSTERPTEPVTPTPTEEASPTDESPATPSETVPSNPTGSIDPSFNLDLEN